MGQTSVAERESKETCGAHRIPKERFQERFGHPYNPRGYQGHPFYGYNCRDCGVHISLVRPTRWLKAEHQWKFPGVDLPEFAGLRAGVPE